MEDEFYKHHAPTERLRSRIIRSISPFLIVISIFGCFSIHAQQLSRDEWGAMPASVSHQDGNWIIAGRKHKVTLNERNLAIKIETGSTSWSTVASTPHDMRVKSDREEFATGLSQAKQIDIVSYDAGFKTGIKISLSGWSHNSSTLDLNLFLTVCLEGRDEDLVF